MLSQEEIEQLRIDHVMIHHRCWKDQLPWPCDTALLLEHLKAFEGYEPSPPIRREIPWHDYLGVPYHVHSSPVPAYHEWKQQRGIAYGLLGPSTSEELAR